MAKGYAANGFPYTPTVGLLNRLNYASNLLQSEGLDNVFAPHNRIASGIHAAIDAWGLKLCAVTPNLYSDTVSAISTPQGFNATEIVEQAANTYGFAFGIGFGGRRRQSVPNRPSGFNDRCDSIVWYRHGRNDHAGPRTKHQARLGYRGGTATLPRYCPAAIKSGGMKDLGMVIPTYYDLVTAHDRIRPYIHKTPVLMSAFLNDLTGAQ